MRDQLFHRKSLYFFPGFLLVVEDEARFITISLTGPLVTTVHIVVTIVENTIHWLADQYDAY